MIFRFPWKRFVSFVDFVLREFSICRGQFRCNSRVSEIFYLKCNRTNSPFYDHIECWDQRTDNDYVSSPSSTMDEQSVWNCIVGTISMVNDKVRCENQNQVDVDSNVHTKIAVKLLAASVSFRSFFFLLFIDFSGHSPSLMRNNVQAKPKRKFAWIFREWRFQWFWGFLFSLSFFGLLAWIVNNFFWPQNRRRPWKIAGSRNTAKKWDLSLRFMVHLHLHSHQNERAHGDDSERDHLFVAWVHFQFACEHSENKKCFRRKWFRSMLGHCFHLLQFSLSSLVELTVISRINKCISLNPINAIIIWNFLVVWFLCIWARSRVFVASISMHDNFIFKLFPSNSVDWQHQRWIMSNKSNHFISAVSWCGSRSIFVSFCAHVAFNWLHLIVQSSFVMIEMTDCCRRQ